MKKIAYILSISLGGCFSGDLGGIGAKEKVDTKLSISTTKLNSGSEIFRAPTSSSDCGYYLVSTGSSQQFRSFVVNNKLYFSSPCKTSDSGAGGWHYGMMSWNIGDSSTTWIDGDLGTAGDQPLITRQTTDKNGFQLRNWVQMAVAFNGTSYKGLISKYYSSTEYGGSSGFFWTPVEFTNPDDFDEADIDVDVRGVLKDTANDGSFKGGSTYDIDLEYKAGTYYAYQTNINSPTNDTYYIVLKSSTDLATFTSPSSYLLKNFRSPNVFKYSDKYYMVAYNTVVEAWQLIPGKSISEFDETKAVSLEIGSAMYGKGGWDDTPFYTTFVGKEPRIAGIEVVNSKIYLFYLAGGFGQLSADGNSDGSFHGVPYDGPRGMGVMELEID